MAANNGVSGGTTALAAATALLRWLRESTPVAPTVPMLHAVATPVRFHTPRLVDADPVAGTPVDLGGADVVRIGAQTKPGDVAQSAAVPRAIVVTLDAADYGTDGTLDQRLDELQCVLNALFTAVKRSSDAISAGDVMVGTAIANGWQGGTLAPMTGLFGGFIKSLHRDFPRARLAAVVTDGDVDATMAALATELAAPPAGGALPEVFVRAGRRMRETLQQFEVAPQPDERPLFRADSVVLATGGARGVTAILAEDVLRRYGCRVVALGRTRTDNIPDELLSMGDEALREYEQIFYRTELASEPKIMPVELKRRFARVQSANEVHRTIEALRGAGGSFEYVSVDLLDQSAVDGVIDDICARYGKIDAIIHGAGTQISKRIAKKSLDEFESVVASKLVGLRSLHRALARRGIAGDVDVHLLTSAFSFWGNDGQPDYGAANETLNRLAAARTSASGATGNWSSLAWLAWPAIGMAREFSWLGAQRDLHPLGKEEGQLLFHALTERAPARPIAILATPRELRFFDVPVSPPTQAPATRIENLDISAPAAPYVMQHLVDRVPTVPGAVEFVMAARAALRLAGGGHVQALHDLRLRSFLRSYADRPSTANVAARLIEDHAAGALVRVRISSDFVHPSGRVLRADVEHFRADVGVGGTPLDLSSTHPAATGPMLRIRDPYLGSVDNVRLSGIFECLEGVAYDDEHQYARLRLSDELRNTAESELMIPAVAIDALARLGAIRPFDGGMPVYVPLAADALRFSIDIFADDAFAQLDGATIVSTRPVPVPGRDDWRRTARTWAIGTGGATLFELRNTIAKVQGSVALEPLLLS